MGQLEGKVAVITGGASGIGLATAQLFASEGASVVIVDRNADLGEVAAKELEGRFVAADVGDRADWTTVVNEATAAFGGIDLAYLNAGVTTGESDITALTDEQYRRIMGANVDGVVFGCRAVVPAIASRGGGAIVATASLAGLIAFSLDPIYTLTKHAVVGLVRSLAQQLEAKNITINAVCPGVVRTPLVGDGAKMLEDAGFPLIEPSEIAAAVLAAATGTASGQAYACQAGAEPVAYEFRDVPGPRRGTARDFRAVRQQ
jgi:NAD(P)-dependent dehydrogenase (short-subunit alcohol dehydrogenase family)